MRKVGNRIRIAAQLVSRGERLPTVVRDLRPPARGRLRHPGRDLARHRRRAEAAARHGDEPGRRAPTESRGVQRLPEGALLLHQAHRSRRCGRAWTSTSRRCCCRTPARARATRASRTCGAAWPTTGWRRRTRIPRAKVAARRGRCELDPELAEAMTLARQGARLVRVGVRAAPSGSCGRRCHQPELRRGALGLGSMLPPRSGSWRGDRGDAQGARARSAVRSLQPVAGAIPAVHWRHSRPRSCKANTRWTGRDCHRAQHYIGSSHLELGDAETALTGTAARRPSSARRAPTTR